jgi:hypothetical protein
MWMPESATEVEQAVADGRLEETHTFDGKALPGRNKDIAIDVCAMTPDEGSLLYGVGQDEHHRLTEFTPFELAGQRERIDQIVSTSIVEVPVVEIRELLTDDDPAVGYIAVGVPQSPRAPHQVVVGGDMRFYGRGATGNRILSEREIADLYARRERWELNRETHLGVIVDAAPLEPGHDWAYLHAFARPLAFDEGFLRRQIEEEHQELADALVGATNVVSELAQYAPDLRHVRGWALHGAEGIGIEDAVADHRRAIRMTISHGGEVRLFACAGARSDRGGAPGPIRIFETLIAGNLTSFLSSAGTFYRRAGYGGNVDVGVAVTGIQNAVSDFMFIQARDDVQFPAPDFRATARVVASELIGAPRDIAMQLLRRFLDAIVAFNYEPQV